MSGTESSSLAGWVIAVVLAVASLGFGYVHLDGLPRLGVELGPDLTVRAVSQERHVRGEHQDLSPGDRITSMGGQSVETLADVRAILQSLPEDGNRGADVLEAGPEELGVDEEDAAEADPLDDSSTIEYRAARPAHRYGIAWQRGDEELDGPPPGVGKDDWLVELDGRLLETRVKADATPSVLASRSEASMVFERQDYVLSGSLRAARPAVPYGAVAVFGVALLALVALRLFRASSLPGLVVAATSLETVCFAWIALVALAYQWVIADAQLTAAALAGFALARPLGSLAHNPGDGRGTLGAWAAVAVGIVAAATLVGCFLGGVFATTEQALYAGALVTVLFLIYEIFMAGTDEVGPDSALEAADGLVVWLLVAGLFVTLGAWLLEPVPFERGGWRWFAFSLPGLVWFADWLRCFRHRRPSSFDAVRDREHRHETLLDYFELVRFEIEQTRPQFVVTSEKASLVIERQEGELAVSEASEQMHDTMCILIQEGVSVPVPDAFRQESHPLTGIARTLKIAFAQRLGRPEEGLAVDDFELILVGIDESPAGDLPVHPPIETLEGFHEKLTAEIWTAALVEAVVALAERPAQLAERLVGSSKPVTPEVDEEEADEEEADEEEADEEEVDEEEVDEEEVDEEEVDEEEVDEEEVDEEEVDEEEVDEEEVDEEEQWGESVAVLSPPPENYESLLEPQMIEAIEYLLESSEHIVLGGPKGAGKSFTARVAHALDESTHGPLALLEADTDDPGELAATFFGEEDGEGGFVGRLSGRALLVCSAQSCSDEILSRLCEEADANEVRLYLAFDDPHAEERSVFEGRSEQLQADLEHRELIVPAFSRRASIADAVLDHLLAQCDPPTEVDLSQRTREMLRAYDYPGGIDEARDILAESLASAGDGLIEPEDLPDRLFE